MDKYLKKIEISLNMKAYVYFLYIDIALRIIGSAVIDIGRHFM